MNIQEININDIQIVEQVRLGIRDLESLMQDIKNTGLKQPIGVMKTKSGEYILKWGQRRLLACKKLGWKKIPANVGADELKMQELLIEQMGENIQRADTTPQEDGRIFERLRSFGLNNSEIAAKLSISPSRVAKCLSIYMNLPDKYRKRVAYSGAGGKDKAGNIPASVANKVISIQKQYGLSEAAREKLLNTIQMEEYGIAELSLISQFLDDGMTVPQAIEKKEHFRLHRCDIVIDLEEVEKLLAKYRMDSTIALLTAIIYGMIPPLKKPSFVKLKQIPDEQKERK